MKLRLEEPVQIIHGQETGMVIIIGIQISKFIWMSEGAILSISDIWFSKKVSYLNLALKNFWEELYKLEEILKVLFLISLKRSIFLMIDCSDEWVKTVTYLIWTKSESRCLFFSLASMEEARRMNPVKRNWNPISLVDFWG